MHVPTETALNADEKKPETQAVQLLEEEKPIPVPYVPAAQFTHVTLLKAPEAVEYKPAEHDEHTVKAEAVL